MWGDDIFLNEIFPVIVPIFIEKCFYLSIFFCTSFFSVNFLLCLDNIIILCNQFFLNHLTSIIIIVLEDESDAMYTKSVEM